MSKYKIISRAGVDYGVYEGTTQKDAFISMLRDSGDDASYGDSHIGTEIDWIISEVND